MDSNPILDSVLQIIAADVKEEFRQAYKESLEELGDNFELLMKPLAHDIACLIKDCNTNITPIEAAMLMVMCEMPGCPEAEVSQCNKYIKAAAVWMLLPENQ